MRTKKHTFSCLQQLEKPPAKKASMSSFPHLFLPLSFFSSFPFHNFPNCRITWLPLSLLLLLLLPHFFSSSSCHHSSSYSWALGLPPPPWWHTTSYSGIWINTMNLTTDGPADHRDRWSKWDFSLYWEMPLYHIRYHFGEHASIFMWGFHCTTYHIVVLLPV